jgi:hypothetical protein
MMASPSRFNFSMMCIFVGMEEPATPIQVVSTKPTESSTSVSPSQRPTVSP